jgi:hypothetical protein
VYAVGRLGAKGKNRLNGYLPSLATARGLINFLTELFGKLLSSPTVLGQITQCRVEAGSTGSKRPGNRTSRRLRAMRAAPPERVSLMKTKKTRLLNASLILVLLLLVASACHQRRTPTDESKTQNKQGVWISQPPDDCPFTSSNDIRGIAFTGRYKVYSMAEADTWFTSWASDGNLYAQFADGKVNDIAVGSVLEAGKKTITTGYAKLMGDDPMALQVISIGSHASSPLPYLGRYPTANLIHDGVWYYGTYSLEDVSGFCGNWCTEGPFVGFFISRDFGQTWNDPNLTPSRSLFGESGLNGSKVKIGSPHFIDFGKNMEHSPDGKAYLVAHGATRPEAHESWISGDAIYLARVTPTPENINDASKYEFFAGYGETGWVDNGWPKWSKKLSDIQPLFDWPDHTGCVTITYDAPLNKYLMCVTHGWPTVGVFDTYILEADPGSIVGHKGRPNSTVPWKLVTYMRKFGEQAYFVHIPSKFISSDGRTAWLCYSNDFTGAVAHNMPPGGLCFAEIKLLLGESPHKP